MNNRRQAWRAAARKYLSDSPAATAGVKSGSDQAEHAGPSGRNFRHHRQIIEAKILATPLAVIKKLEASNVREVTARSAITARVRRSSFRCGHSIVGPTIISEAERYRCIGEKGEAGIEIRTAVIGLPDTLPAREHERVDNRASTQQLEADLAAGVHRRSSHIKRKRLTRG